MQCEGLRHALTHGAAAVLAPQEQSLLTANDAPCVECSILASGTNVIGGNLQVVAIVSLMPVLLLALPRSASLFAPSYYQSRAPPALP